MIQSRASCAISRDSFASGCGSGCDSLARRRSRRSRAGSLWSHSLGSVIAVEVFFAEVIGDLVGRDMPAAIVTAWDLDEATAAEKWSAEEELFEARMVGSGQVAGVARQRHVTATTFTRTVVQFLQERSEMVVNATRNDAHALAERARHAELRHDRLANELALVAELVEQVGEVFLDLEGDHGCLAGLARGPG